MRKVKGKSNDLNTHDTSLEEDILNKKELLDDMMVKLKNLTLSIKNKERVLDKLLKIETKILKKKHHHKLSLYCKFLDSKDYIQYEPTLFVLLLFLLIAFSFLWNS